MRGRAQSVTTGPLTNLLLRALAMDLTGQPILLPLTSQPAASSINSFPGFSVLANRSSPRIAIKSKGKIVFINLWDVVAVRAEGNYVLLQSDSTSFLLRETISAVSERLEPYGFVRIHRSALVNPSFVEEIRPYSTGEYGLRLKGGKEYTVTRTYKKNLKALAEFWIGVNAFSSDRQG
jgi:two-component system LytT family response regulator